MFFIVLLIYMSTPQPKKKRTANEYNMSPGDRETKNHLVTPMVLEDLFAAEAHNEGPVIAGPPNQNGGKRTRRRKNGNKKRKTKTNRRKTLKKRRKTRRRKGGYKLHGGKRCGCK